MNNEQILSGWSKLRFEWKERIIESQDLSRRAKQMGVVLCDRYASRTSGICWPANGTLAKSLGITVRPVHQYIAELLADGPPFYKISRGVRFRASDPVASVDIQRVSNISEKD